MEDSMHAYENSHEFSVWRIPRYLQAPPFIQQEDEDGTDHKDMPDGKYVALTSDQKDTKALQPEKTNDEESSNHMPTLKIVSKSKNVSNTWGDLIADNEQPCDGMGETIAGCTTSNVYLCLACANCRLCQKCYDKVVKRNKDGTWDHWRSFCWKNHKYIKHPIKGWKGLRDGYYDDRG